MYSIKFSHLWSQMMSFDKGTVVTMSWTEKICVGGCKSLRCSLKCCRGYKRSYVISYLWNIEKVNRMTKQNRTQIPVPIWTGASTLCTKCQKYTPSLFPADVGCDTEYTAGSGHWARVKLTSPEVNLDWILHPVLTHKLLLNDQASMLSGTDVFWVVEGRAIWIWGTEE